MVSEGPSLRLAGVAKAYGERRVLADLHLDLNPGTSCAVVGASGAGKSTLLRLVAGLEAPDDGRIEIGGALASEGGRVRIPPHARGVGVLFQSPALWPHLSVAENVGFGLEAARAERDERVARLLVAAGLGGWDRRRVDGLSGGEARRVSLLRALAPRPALLLLDEPLAHLDPANAILVRRLLAQECAEFRPAVLVTAHAADAFPEAEHTLALRA